MLDNEVDLIDDSMFWFGSKDQQDAWQRIKTALVELGTTNNTGSPKLSACEQLYIGCAIDGASCGCDGDQSKCRQLRAGA